MPENKVDRTPNGQSVVALMRVPKKLQGYLFTRSLKYKWMLWMVS
jgi:hypothetical protein